MAEDPQDLKEAVEVSITTGYESANRLDELGLSPDILMDAVHQAYTRHAAYVTEDEPRFSMGITMYCKVTGFLRKSLKATGWKAETAQNFERTTNSDGSIAIMVAGGDRNTGIKDREPCTVSSKGQVVKQTIDAGQLPLFDLRGIPSIAPRSGPEMWVLLYYVDRKANEIRVELSQPETFQSKAPMEHWRKRIILPEPIKVEGQMQEPETPEEKKTDEIDIDIELR